MNVMIDFLPVPIKTQESLQLTTLTRWLQMCNSPGFNSKEISQQQINSNCTSTEKNQINLFSKQGTLHDTLCINLYQLSLRYCISLGVLSLRSLWRLLFGYESETSSYGPHYEICFSLPILTSSATCYERHFESASHFLSEFCGHESDYVTVIETCEHKSPLKYAHLEDGLNFSNIQILSIYLYI